MIKRFSVIIIALICVFALSVSVGAVVITRATAQNNVEKELKSEREKSYIKVLFHDQGSNYMEPMEPDKGENLTLRLRTERYNVTSAQIQYTTDNGVNWKSVDMKYDGIGKTGRHDLWSGTFKADGDLIKYRFIVSNADSYNTVYYDTESIDIKEGDLKKCWQVVPGHKTPDWAKGALWYSAMPDAFYNGNTTNDKNTSGNNTFLAWNKLRKGLDDKYGGDLQGINSKLDYIKDLGADAVYINPIQKSYQNAGYGPVRYDEIESSFGNEADLKNLSDSAHERGLKLMGDVVLTFSVDKSYYFNKGNYWPVKGAYQSLESPWKNLFKFYKWPDNHMIAWSSPAHNLNTDIADTLIFGKSGYLAEYSKFFDGYRFDCGGWLWGTSETNNIEALSFVKGIRKDLKELNKDFFILTESDWYNMNTASWDGAWNIGYMPKLQDYAKGLINETLMLEAMKEYEMTIPRNVALCLENMMCDHDSYRVVQHDDYMYNAAALIQMTFLGAPCIFYGEEVDYVKENEEGIGTNQSFYSMEWDDSKWDQSRLAFYKATAELRQEYPCVKTGVVKILGTDINSNTLTFGRWDKKDAAITVASQNEDATEMEINAEECDIKDGTTLTDWYTGASYTVKDGKVKVNVIPGGTVLVTGKKASKYRNGFEIKALGGASRKNSITMRNSESFTVSGKGSIKGNKDKVTLCSTPIYDDFSIYSNIKGDKSAALMVRENNNPESPYYAATVSGDKLIITARKSSGKKAIKLAEIKCDKNTYIKLARGSNNCFTAYKTVVKDGELGEFSEIENSTVYIPMNNKVYCGFAPLKGEMKINNVTVEKGNGRLTFDNFEGKSPISMFDGISKRNISIKNGSLTINPVKKQQISELLTNSADDDWTFKAEIDYVPKGDSYGGVASRQDENNFVIAGRKIIDNKTKIFIGKYTNGKIDVFDYVDDPNNGGSIVIQLQRIGAYYSAVYSADKGSTWQYIGKLFANYSLERVGLLISGSQSLTADYVSFGDSINDSKSVNTPYAPTAIDVKYNNNNTAEEAHYEYISGDWSTITGGWKQNDDNSFGIAAAVNQEYDKLYAEATLKTEGKGWTGIAFGLKDYNVAENSGYSVKYYNGGKIELVKDNKVLAEGNALPEKDGTLRIVLQAQEGKIKVYTGQNPAVIISVDNTDYKKGYVAFCTQKAKAEIKNFHIGYTSANWLWVSGEGTGGANAVTTQNSEIMGRQIHSVTTLAGYGFTDLAFSLKISCTPAKDEGDSMAGVLLSASEGKSAAVDGVFIGINGKRELVISEKGNIKSSCKLPDNKNYVTIFVVKQGGNYKVFTAENDEPVLTFTEKIKRGGVFALYSYNATGSFVNLSLESIQPNTDYSKTNIAADWKNNSYSVFSDGLNSADSENNYLFYEKNYADFSIKNGTLNCENSTDWIGGATIIGNTYSDFNMDFKLKINSCKDGWMSIGLRKNMPLGNHNNSGVSVMLTGGGDIFFFDSKAQKQYSNNVFTGFKTGNWYDMRITAKGSNITVYLNGKKMISYNDTEYHDGFISFTSGKTNFEIDDIKITPIR